MGLACEKNEISRHTCVSSLGDARKVVRHFFL